MPRKALTAAEDTQARKRARYWLKVLGIDLKQHGLERLLTPRKGGRSKHDDAPMLASLELFLRTTKRERGLSRNAALHLLVDAVWLLGWLPGYTADAGVARLHKKLKDGGYDKKDSRTLVPPEWLERGIDPETFLTFPISKTGDLRGIDPEKFTPTRKLARLKRLPSPNPKGGTAFIVTETDD
jgi:hypothetical protein